MSQEAIDICRGITDDQAERMAYNLEFAGPALKEVKVIEFSLIITQLGLFFVNTPQTPAISWLWVYKLFLIYGFT